MIAELHRQTCLGLSSNTAETNHHNPTQDRFEACRAHVLLLQGGIQHMLQQEDATIRALQPPERTLPVHLSRVRSHLDLALSPPSATRGIRVDNPRSIARTKTDKPSLGNSQAFLTTVPIVLLFGVQCQLMYAIPPSNSSLQFSRFRNYFSLALAVCSCLYIRIVHTRICLVYHPA
jgi:hypothetical protein